METLDRLAPQDREDARWRRKRTVGRERGYQRLRTLLNKAGGRNMLERWDDRALTSLNVNISNTFHHHQACMMVAGQMFGSAPLGDEKFREAAKSECRAYRPPYADATRAYGRLR